MLPPKYISISKNCKRVLNKMINKKKLNIGIYLSVVIVLVVIVILVSSTNLFENVESKEYIDNVSLKIISPSWSISYLNISTKNTTVADLLSECADKYNFTIEKEFFQGYDSFLFIAINNLENGDDDKYWQYYVNGKFADVGCSKFVLNDNDIIEWRFEDSPW